MLAVVYIIHRSVFRLKNGRHERNSIEYLLVTMVAAHIAASESVRQHQITDLYRISAKISNFFCPNLPFSKLTAFQTKIVFKILVLKKSQTFSDSFYQFHIKY